ncbi:lipopolysaccharide core heptose(I) kinase [Desulfosarcina ovata subsp. sediminis]|uniref:Lipopolysaccharide core heptose(I) kinase n=1 Tax=Desulfosarcina ovata subsp. sediminis TaxID=885957 RepID=A0A5K7ZP50_9BACT|nr:lipopolysaccharide core heptose(I) kinase RfaP [Desulfosarcina ovata]BBO80580.1 lipopolysaccharide core heptose(I) kinase [Desulfosarcina ovata subsp. sediminis]
MLMLEEPFRSDWKDQDIYELLRNMDGHVYRDKEGRRTFRFEHSGKSYFAKVFSGIGWKTLVACLLKFRRPFVSAANEWRAVERLHQLGIPTMRVVGYGRRGRNPAKIESFILTEELKPTTSLEDYCRYWPSNPPSAALKRALVQRVAEVAKTLHGNGIIHRDLYICHFLLDIACAPLDDNGKLANLFLIDLHRATQNRRLRRRWRVKDVAGLYFSSLDIGLTQRDRLRFMSVYSGLQWRDTLQCQQRFWKQVERRGKAVYREFRRKHPELFV